MSSASGGTKWKCQYCPAEISCAQQGLTLKFCSECGKKQVENAETVKTTIQERRTESFSKNEEEEAAMRKVKHIQDGGQQNASSGERNSKHRPIIIEEPATNISDGQANGGGNGQANGESGDQFVGGNGNQANGEGGKDGSGGLANGSGDQSKDGQVSGS